MPLPARRPPDPCSKKEQSSHCMYQVLSPPPFLTSTIDFQVHLIFLLFITIKYGLFCPESCTQMPTLITWIISHSLFYMVSNITLRSCILPVHRIIWTLHGCIAPHIDTDNLSRPDSLMAISPWHRVVECKDQYGGEMACHLKKTQNECICPASWTWTNAVMDRRVNFCR